MGELVLDKCTSSIIEQREDCLLQSDPSSAILTAQGQLRFGASMFASSAQKCGSNCNETIAPPHPPAHQ